MLYKSLKLLASRGVSEELRQKIDLFYALGRLTEAEYLELIGASGGVSHGDE